MCRVAQFAGHLLAVDKRGPTVLLFEGKEAERDSCLFDMTCVFPNGQLKLVCLCSLSALWESTAVPLISHAPDSAKDRQGV